MVQNATRTKFMISAAVMVGLLSVVPVARGDYVNPPGWDSNSYFTHQVWEFNSPEPAQPLAPDGEVSNPYGTPEASWYVHPGGMYTWSEDIMGQPDVSGRSGFVGGMVDGWISFDIPNDPNPELTKEVWVQYVFLNADSATAAITASGSSASLVSVVSLEDLGPGGTSGTYHWYRRTELWEIDPQPGMETVTISTTGLSMLDQIAVDTRCIPEPATTGLLACGALGLIRRRKRKR